MTTGDNKQKPNRGGTTKYGIANLVVMLAVFGVIIFSANTTIPGPWWKWLLIAPVALFVAGFIEERFLSCLVNGFVKSLFEKQETRSP